MSDPQIPAAATFTRSEFSPIEAGSARSWTDREALELSTTDFMTTTIEWILSEDKAKLRDIWRNLLGMVVFDEI
jgi:hypothetical protein